jgi:hypothetical protein
MGRALALTEQFMGRALGKKTCRPYRFIKDASGIDIGQNLTRNGDQTIYPDLE